MKKLLLLVVSFAFCSMAYAGGSGTSAGECKWVEQGEAKACPTCPKAKACPKAKTKRCPKAKACPKAKEVVKWKTRLKTKYVNVPVEKVVYKYVDRTKPLPTHTFGILGGLGPNGVVTDYYDTRERPNEYVFREGKGTLIGLQYQFRFSSSWSVSALALSNESFLGGIHYSK